MIVDLNPHYWQKTKMRRPLLVAGACLFCFFAALPMVTKGGMYVFQVIIKNQTPTQPKINLTQNRILFSNSSLQIHLEHQVSAYYGLPSLNVLSLLGSMDAKNSTMIYITCLATRWT